MIRDTDLRKMDLKTIDEEIKSRETLLEQMVGTLYPNILRDEIAQLLCKKHDLMFPQEIKVLQGIEVLEKYMPDVAKMFKEKYAGWHVGSPLTPGKAWYNSFCLRKDDKRKIVHVFPDNFSTKAHRELIPASTNSHYYEETYMLKELEAALKDLSPLLDDRSKWDSLIVNRRKPHTYRVHTQLPNGLRLCLHKFNPCDTHESFLHPHPWPGAFVILHGAYEMEVGYSTNRTEPPAHVLKLVLEKGSKYEIVTPLTWHSVTPLTTTYTVMVNGEPWEADYAHKDVRTTKGKDLDKMPEDELEEHLRIFKKLLHDYYS